ncbi:MAG TPA: PEGA domain-containing protein, partial [bacterium]|nr:PEGA domain-containing protein [bacterium]
VWIKGTGISGRTAPFNSLMRPGSYEITFKKEPDYLQWRKTVNMGNQEKVTALMQKTKCLLALTVIEAGRRPVEKAGIFIDGNQAGMTDSGGKWEGPVPAGKRVIEIEKEGLYLARRAEKNCSPGAREQLEIILETVSSRPPALPEGKTARSNIIIDTRPHFNGAVIYFDGNLQGETVRRITDVKPGVHEIAIRHSSLGKLTSEIEIDGSGKTWTVTLESSGEVKIE